MQFIENPLVLEKFDGYPEFVKDKMYTLRDLVVQAAGEIEGLTKLEETLKWDEPSFITKYGSTVRMDWKDARPDVYAMYFHCQTKLVETFKELYRDILCFDGNRAIVFECDAPIPQAELKHCIRMALNYHKLKHLPLLGA